MTVVAGQEPSVAAIIATLNSAKHLPACLAALREQEYGGDLSIVIADGGSEDGTPEIARSFGATVVPNPLMTGEAGKAAGVRAASPQAELLLLLDSDNVIIGRDWLRRMVAPFEDPIVAAAEPARWHYRRDDHYINRWHALSGVADPLALYVGNYARRSLLTGRWTELPVFEEQRDGWLRVQLKPEAVPTLGANGYLVRRAAFERVPVGEYLFDIDHAYELVRQGASTIALVDVAVHHAFCDSLRQFVRKTRRRVDDYHFFRTQRQRSYPWTGQLKGAIGHFVLETITVVPLLVQVLRGLRAVRDPAWFFHVVACWITLGVYAAGVVRGRVRPAMMRREGWSQ